MPANRDERRALAARAGIKAQDAPAEQPGPDWMDEQIVAAMVRLIDAVSGWIESKSRPKS